MNSSNHLPIITNENELKRRDLDDRDTGDTKNELITTTTTAATSKQKQFNAKAINILQNGIDKSKEILTTIKGIFKL